MAIAIITPAAPQATGPGYYLYATMSGFAFNSGDILVAQVVDHATATPILQCVSTMLGLVAQQVILGHSTSTKLGAPFGTTRSQAQGSAVDIFLEWERANLTFVDSATFTGWTWESLGQAWILAALGTYAAENGAPSLTNSLKTTYHNSP